MTLIKNLRYGVRYDESGSSIVFSLFSANALRIELYLYPQPLGAAHTDRFVLDQKECGNWEYRLPPSRFKPDQKAIYYGYRAWGPNWKHDPRWEPGTEYGFIEDCDDRGNRFNPNKLLLDPWTTEISHDPQPRLSDIDPNEYDDAYYSGEATRCIDTGKVAPKSMFVLQERPISFGKKPERPLKDDIIYEVHVRGFTRQDEALPESLRGTFRGAAMKARYLRELGITAVEFLPVHQFASEQNDDGDPRGDNYWGYMTLGYFAPNRRYSSDKSPGGPTAEFKAMAAAFHEAGIKVFLDVVYNHTGEGLLKRTTDTADSRDNDDLQQPDRACLLSFRGIDNATYYTLRTGTADRGKLNRRYQDNSGCGGNLNVVSPVAGRLILDSLRYWADEMGVDGFRFDLAPVLGNTIASGGFRYAIGSENNLLRRIATELPRRSDATPTGVDLIAEPWATGSGNTYQLGQFPDGWSEWNDVYRIAARQFENKLGVIDLPAHRIANIVSGSEAQFHHASPRKNPRPWNSVNYVDSHDGYTLRDVFSFTGDGDVWNHAGDPVRQRKAVRNAIALLMTSAGVPMIAGGDELFRTLGGSVGVAATDDATVHLDWKTWNCRNRGMERGDLGSIERCALDDSIRAYRFMRFMIELRTRFPWLRPDHYFTGATVIGLGIKDIAWYRSDGDELSGADWTGPRFLAWRIANRGYRQAGDIGSTLVAYNWSDGFIDCRLPRPMEGMRWRRQADTAEWFEYTANIDTSATEIEGRYGMYERSIVVLFEE